MGAGLVREGVTRGLPGRPYEVVAVLRLDGEGDAYADRNCSLARALEVVGERWTLLIVRDAFFGVRRFGDFASQLKIPRAVRHDQDGGLLDHEGRCRDCGSVVPVPEIRVEPGPGFDATNTEHDPVSNAINTPRRLLEPIMAPRTLSADEGELSATP